MHVLMPAESRVVELCIDVGKTSNTSEQHNTTCQHIVCKILFIFSSVGSVSAQLDT